MRRRGGWTRRRVWRVWRAWKSSRAAATATTMPVSSVVVDGTRVTGFTLAAHAGSRPSRAIAKKMRGWLMSITSSTDVMPATAPADTR